MGTYSSLPLSDLIFSSGTALFVRYRSTPIVVRRARARVWDKSRLVLVPNELGWGRRQKIDRGLDVGQLLGEFRVFLLLLSKGRSKRVLKALPVSWLCLALYDCLLRVKNGQGGDGHAYQQQKVPDTQHFKIQDQQGVLEYYGGMLVEVRYLGV